MRYAQDPRQKVLFDPAQTMFSPMTLKFLRNDWPGLFRTQILQLMPAQALGKKFHRTLGCPTKELYGMAGAIFRQGVFQFDHRANGGAVSDGRRMAVCVKRLEAAAELDAYFFEHGDLRSRPARVTWRVKES